MKDEIRPAGKSSHFLEVPWPKDGRRCPRSKTPPIMGSEGIVVWRLLLLAGQVACRQFVAGSSVPASSAICKYLPVKEFLLLRTPEKESLRGLGLCPADFLFLFFHQVDKDITSRYYM